MFTIYYIIDSCLHVFLKIVTLLTSQPLLWLSSNVTTAVKTSCRVVMTWIFLAGRTRPSY